MICESVLIELSPGGERGNEMEEVRRRRLTAKRKFEIYLETRKDGAKVGEILRREGIHLNDLREIEELVERGAVGSLKSRGPGRLMRQKIDPLEYDQLKRELKDKEKAMSDLMVEYTLLKKSERSGSPEHSLGPSFEGERNARRSWKRSRKPREVE